MKNEKTGLKKLDVVELIIASAFLIVTMASIIMKIKMKREEEKKLTVEQYLLNRFKTTRTFFDTNKVYNDLKSYNLTDKQIQFILKYEDILKKAVKTRMKAKIMLKMLLNTSDYDTLKWIIANCK